MPKSTWSAALVGIVLQAACGSSGPSGPQEQSTPLCSGPVSQSCWLTVSEPGFVHAAVPVTDGVSTAMVDHTPGKFCMSGHLDPGPTNANWGSTMVLSLVEGDLTNAITAPFSADALGIAQVRFTLDSVPLAGLSVAIPALQRADCLTIPDCLTAASFVLMQDGSTQTVILYPGTVTASLDSFLQPSWGDQTLAFDKNLMVGVQFQPMMLAGVAFDYDFCVQDLTFLDSGGQEVAP
jgi:hypothetical protein